MSKDTALLNDQLGKNPQTQAIIIPDYDQDLKIGTTTKFEKKDVSSDYLWGGTTWGGGLWDEYLNTTNFLVAVVNHNNVHREFFADTDFKNTTHTTATWSGSGSVTFTDGQIAYSEIVAWNPGVNISKIRLSVDFTGDLQLEVSSNDGSNWDTVTNRQEHTISNVGEKLRYRITSTGASTMTNLVLEVL